MLKFHDILRASQKKWIEDAKKNVLLWFQPLFCRGVSSIAPATTPHHAKLEINNYCNNSLFLTWCQHINRFFFRPLHLNPQALLAPRVLNFFGH
jgi:hypothetical protein